MGKNFSIMARDMKKWYKTN